MVQAHQDVWIVLAVVEHHAGAGVGIGDVADMYVLIHSADGKEVVQFLTVLTDKDLLAHGTALPMQNRVHLFHKVAAHHHLTHRAVGIFGETLTVDDFHIHKFDVAIAHKVEIGKVKQAARVARHHHVISTGIVERQTSAARHHLHLRLSCQFFLTL